MHSHRTPGDVGQYIDVLELPQYVKVCFLLSLKLKELALKLLYLHSCVKGLLLHYVHVPIDTHSEVRFVRLHFFEMLVRLCYDTVFVVE